MVWDYKIIHIYPIRLILFVIWSIQLDKSDIRSDFLLFEIFQIEYLNIFELDTGWKFSFSNIQNIGFFFQKYLCPKLDIWWSNPKLILWTFLLKNVFFCFQISDTKIWIPEISYSRFIWSDMGRIFLEPKICIRADRVIRNEHP